MRKVILLLIGWSLIAASPAQADGLSNIEKFNCGRLGTVIMSSSPKASIAAGHVTYQAKIAIPSRKINQIGVLHNSMGGNDRTFTSKSADNFRSIDDTTPGNPVMMSILGLGYFYGKERQQITVTTIKEAYSCIPK